MNFIIAWFIKKIGVSTLVIFIEAMYVVVIFAFFVFMLNTIILVRHQVQYLMNFISSSSSGSSIDLSHMFGYLNAIGFFDAFATAEPFLSSALIFLLVRLLYKISIKAYKEFILSIYHVASTL